jgi:hypothetical protein
MNNIVKGSMALQYAVSLAAAGLVDNIPMDVNLAERLQLLIEHESAWKDTPWYPIDGYDGALGLAASSGNLLVFFRVWNDSVRLGRHLVFQRLPSIHNGVPDFTSRMDPDFHVHEFSIDSSQDLLIYAQYVNWNACFAFFLVLIIFLFIVAIALPRGRWEPTDLIHARVRVFCLCARTSFPSRPQPASMENLRRV